MFYDVLLDLKLCVCVFVCVHCPAEQAPSNEHSWLAKPLFVVVEAILEGIGTCSPSSLEAKGLIIPH